MYYPKKNNAGISFIVDLNIRLSLAISFTCRWDIAVMIPLVFDRTLAVVMKIYYKDLGTASGSWERLARVSLLTVCMFRENGFYICTHSHTAI